MSTGYEKIIRENLQRVDRIRFTQLEHTLPASREADRFRFNAFGEECTISSDGIALSDKRDFGPKGLLISLYVLHAREEPLRLDPFKAFKDFPGSMPYQGAFTANSERTLVPYVLGIKQSQERIVLAFHGQMKMKSEAGDFSFLLFPLPKIALSYIFYLPDDDFPASVTCLFSSNAASFMPLDGLADVAEYSSQRIIELLKREGA